MCSTTHVIIENQLTATRLANHPVLVLKNFLPSSRIWLGFNGMWGLSGATIGFVISEILGGEEPGLISEQDSLLFENNPLLRLACFRLSSASQSGFLAGSEFPGIAEPSISGLFEFPVGPTSADVWTWGGKGGSWGLLFDDFSGLVFPVFPFPATGFFRLWFVLLWLLFLSLFEVGFRFPRASCNKKKCIERKITKACCYVVCPLHNDLE